MWPRRRRWPRPWATNHPQSPAVSNYCSHPVVPARGAARPWANPWANRGPRHRPEPASAASPASPTPESCVTRTLVGPSTFSAVGRGFESLPRHPLPDKKWAIPGGGIRLRCRSGCHRGCHRPKTTQETHQTRRRPGASCTPTGRTARSGGPIGGVAPGPRPGRVETTLGLRPMRHVLTALRQALDQAVDGGLVPRNVARSAQPFLSVGQPIARHARRERRPAHRVRRGARYSSAVPVASRSAA